MVKILNVPQQPSLGSQIGSAFGSGFAGGVQSNIGQLLGGLQQAKQRKQGIQALQKLGIDSEQAQAISQLPQHLQGQFVKQLLGGQQGLLAPQQMQVGAQALLEKGWDPQQIQTLYQLGDQSLVRSALRNELTPNALMKFYNRYFGQQQGGALQGSPQSGALSFLQQDPEQQLNQNIEQLAPTATAAQKTQDLDTEVGSAAAQLAPEQQRTQGEINLPTDLTSQIMQQVGTETDDVAKLVQDIMSRQEKEADPSLMYLGQRISKGATNVGGIIPYGVAAGIEKATGSPIAGKFKGDLLKLQKAIVGQERQAPSETVRRIGDFAQDTTELLALGGLGTGLSLGLKGVPYLQAIGTTAGSILGTNWQSALKLMGGKHAAKKLASSVGLGPTGEEVFGVLGQVGMTGLDIYRGRKNLNLLKNKLYESAESSQAAVVPTKPAQGALNDITIAIRDQPSMKGSDILLRQAEAMENSFFGNRISVRDLAKQKQAFNTLIKDSRLSKKAQNLALQVSKKIGESVAKAATGTGADARAAQDLLKADGIYSFLKQRPYFADFGRKIIGRTGKIGIPAYAAGWALGFPLQKILGPVAAGVAGYDLFKMGSSMLLADKHAANLATDMLRAFTANNIKDGVKAFNNLNKHYNKVAPMVTTKNGKSQLLFIDPKTGKIKS